MSYFNAKFNFNQFCVKPLYIVLFFYQINVYYYYYYLHILQFFINISFFKQVLVFRSRLILLMLYHALCLLKIKGKKARSTLASTPLPKTPSQINEWKKHGK